MKSQRTWLFLLAALIVPAARGQFTGMGGGGMGGMGGLGIGSAENPQAPRKATWQPWLNVGGTYRDSARYVAEDGSVSSGPGSFGASGGWGVRGSKSLEQTAAFIAYVGRASFLSGASGVRGTSHVVNGGVSHRFTRNLYAGFQQSFGTTLGGYGYGSGFAGIGGFSQFGPTPGFPSNGLLEFEDPGNNGLVDEEIFDNRVKFFSSTGSVGYRLGLRSSVTGQASARFVRRNNATLSDTDVYSGGASYSYAINAKTLIGTGYTLGRFRYPNRFGDARFQSLSLFASRQLSRRASIGGSAGAVLFDSQYIGAVAIDPDLAATLGVTSIVSVQKARRLTFSGGVRAGYNADFASFGAFAMRGVIPGNGILYGGIRDTVGVSAGRALMRERASMSLTASMSRVSGILQPDTQIRYQAMAMTGWRLGAGFHAGFGGGLRWQRLARTGPYLPQKFATVGISWSPGDYPLFF